MTLGVYVRVQANPDLSSLRARLAKVRLQRVDVQHEAKVLRLQDEKLANLEEELIAKIAAEGDSVARAATAVLPLQQKEQLDTYAQVRPISHGGFVTDVQAPCNFSDILFHAGFVSQTSDMCVGGWYVWGASLLSLAGMLL